MTFWKLKDHIKGEWCIWTPDTDDCHSPPPEFMRLIKFAADDEKRCLDVMILFQDTTFHFIFDCTSLFVCAGELWTGYEHGPNEPLSSIRSISEVRAVVSAEHQIA